MSRHLALYSVGKKDLYLYDTGNENTSVTGGFAAYPYRPTWSSATPIAPTVSKASTAITLTLSQGDSSGGSYFTESSIDLTKFSTLILDVSSATSAAGGYVTLGISSTKNDGYATVSTASVCSGNSIANKTISIDISALSGSYYLLLYLGGNGSKSITFTKWWLK